MNKIFVEGFCGFRQVLGSYRIDQVDDSLLVAFFFLRPVDVGESGKIYNRMKLVLISSKVELDRFFIGDIEFLIFGRNGRGFFVVEVGKP